MAIIMVQGRQVSSDPAFNAFATARFTRHNAEGRAEYSDPNDSSQRLSLNPEQYRRVLQAYQASEMQRANGFVRDQRRFARTGSAAPADANAPVILVNGRPARANAGLANFVFAELSRNASYRPITQDGRVVISLTQTQYDRAGVRFDRHLIAEARQVVRQHRPHASHRQQAANTPIRAVRQVDEGGHVVYISQEIITVGRGG